MATKTKKRIETIKCGGACGKLLLPDSFYDKGDGSGKFCVCKNCVKLLIYNPKTNDINTQNFIDFLEEMQLPYLAKIWNAVSDEESPVDEYVTRLERIATTQGVFPCDLTEDDVADIFDSTHLKITQELIRKWNTDDPEQIRFLEKEFQDWAMARDIDDKAILELILQICYAKWDIAQGRKAGDFKRVREATILCQDLMGSANLKPVQDAINSTKDNQSFGMFIKRLESEEPIGVDDEPPWAQSMRLWVVGQLHRIENVQGDTLNEYMDKLAGYTLELDDGDEADEGKKEN